MREATLERRCGGAVRAAGGEWIKLLSAALVGLPDRLAVLPGGVVWFIELKQPGSGRTGRLQKWWGRRFRELGCNYCRVSTYGEFVRAVFSADVDEL